MLKNFIKQSIPFLERRCQTKSDWKIQRQVEDDWWYWFPIVMGVSTREEMDKANAVQIQILNEVAKKKQQLLGGVSVDG